MATSPQFASTPRVSGVTFVNGDGTGLKTLMSAGSSGTRIEGIFISSSDTVTVNLAFYINDGSNDLYIGNVQVVAGAGYTSVAHAEGIGTLGLVQAGCLLLPNGYALKCNPVAAVTAAKTVSVVAMGGDF